MDSRSLGLGAYPERRQPSGSKDTQAAYYDQQEADEFEIERPRGAGRLYEYFLRFKFRRSLELLDEPIAGRTVLCICAGAGMDVEFLTERGARVVGLDLSLGALRGAQERARRHRFAAGFVVGDAERLPFPDQAFDYCYVHDGLHHLDEPEKALGELARLARRGVIITEPAEATLTALAIRWGIIQAYEEAGNYVIRFTPERLSEFFRERGFARTASSRYLMKYPHVPNALFRLLSGPVLFPITRATFRAVGDGLFARAGNKLGFVARRDERS
jgi:ubiquinone/menaquinone biosynthesis C-methylase UbiE